MKSRTLLFLTVVLFISAVSLFIRGRGAGPGITSEKAVTGSEILGMRMDESDSGYRDADRLLADISRQLNQPNILKDDILRGWYLGGKDDRKFGTPDTWIFLEDGSNSKWMSPNALEEEDLIDDRDLCRRTAGFYMASCLDTSDSDCEYVTESSCQCSAGSVWVDTQGCILTTERGSLVSVNSAELERGWYLGLPNEKKLNTPPDWVWVEKGIESVWTKP